MIEGLNLHDCYEALVALGHEGFVVRIVSPEGLDSALHQPFQEVFGRVLYPPPFRRAAAFFCFVEPAQSLKDGNKRLGWIGSQLILLDAGWWLTAPEEESIAFSLEMARQQKAGTDTIDRLGEWFEVNTIKMDLPL